MNTTTQVTAWAAAESRSGGRVRMRGLVRLPAGPGPAPVLVKPHRDAVRKLSVEYARLARENARLRGLMSEAVSLLGGGVEGGAGSGPGEGTGSPLRAECSDCAGAVGQAIWDCGTLDIDCIRNCIDATSQCYGCVCEVLDYWWQSDAPNCYQKEIVSLMQETEIPKEEVAKVSKERQTELESSIREKAEEVADANDDITDESDISPLSPLFASLVIFLVTPLIVFTWL